ncbi:hypothetical protein Pint_24928 [Pistacia integerrima]|uniref:Uncharacterized protein n=1 Tax=Pistacia integerrima TaxID=434235 RepID=A0ACC0YE96_9ROSI|nr:hypothetical protein Pint_24928 [Pistacia integerrima]
MFAFYRFLYLYKLTFCTLYGIQKYTELLFCFSSFSKAVLADYTGSFASFFFFSFFTASSSLASNTKEAI